MAQKKSEAESDEELAKKMRSQMCYLNFGGPGDVWLTNNLYRMASLYEENKKYYGEPNRHIQFEIKGVNATIFTHGIHRGLLLTIPDDASAETIEAFKKARKVAVDICRTSDYSLLRNNCVTAVAKTLHALDSRITPGNMIWPWNFDEHIENYGKHYQNFTDNTYTGDFISKYMEIADHEFFSSGKERHWEAGRDIVEHAYVKSRSGERTKSTLINLGWVTEDKQHILRPTERAPAAFREGLLKFNLDYEKVLHLKSLYNAEAGRFSRKDKDLFKDNPKYETALERLKVQAVKNPKGAAEKVLDKLTSEEQPNDNKRDYSNPLL